MVSLIDISGQRFEKLVVLGDPVCRQRREYFWRCRCDCGKEKYIRGVHIRNGKTKSCGCVHGVKISNPITYEQLVRLVQYDPKTGHFRWLVDGRKYRAGDRADRLNLSTGYPTLVFGKRIYTAHAVAWLFMHKKWAKKGIDHEDTDRSNCAWRNLRAATQKQNTANSRLSKNSTTGFKGVSRVGNNRYRAYAQGKHLGVFGTAVEAAQAYDAKAIALYGEFARTNFGERRARLD